MHRPSIARTALTYLIAAAGSLGLSAIEQKQASRPRGWRNPFKSRLSSNGFKPHQDDRNFRRARRGLAPVTR